MIFYVREHMSPLSPSAGKRLVGVLVFCLYFISLAVATASPDHWTTLDLSGKAIYALVVDPSNPNTVYAGGDGGIFKSTDAGATWTFFRIGSPDISMVHHLVIDPQYPRLLYASTGSDFGGGYLFKSADGGETWSLIHPGRRPSCTHPTQSPGVLVVDPHHPEVVYVGVNSLGFLKSGDGGRTWTMLGMCPGCTAWHIDMTAMVLDPTNPAILYAGDTGGGVLKLDTEANTVRTILQAGDNGAEDGRDLRIYSINGIAVAPTQPTTLYVSTHGRGILKSTDGGTTWQELGLKGFTGAILVDPTAPAVLYANTYDDVFMSTDSGEHWENLQLPSPHPLPGSNAITVNPIGTILYVGTNNGLSVYRLRE